MMPTPTVCWDYPGLVRRLNGVSRARLFSSDGDLFREAALAISSLIEANNRLHRRVQSAESGWVLEVSRARERANFFSAMSSSTFNRMLRAFEEVKRINDDCRRAVDDGCDEYGYHSVMDSRADGGPAEPGAIYANRFKSSKGGVVTRRPADVVKLIVDELIRLRSEKE